MRIYYGKSVNGIIYAFQDRTLYIDNFYELAISCLKQENRIVGTVRNKKSSSRKSRLKKER